MAFKALKAEKLDVSTFNRSEQNTEEAFRELGEPKTPSVQLVQSSTSVRQYIVKQTDEFIVVDPRSAAMKIVLYPPSGFTQSVAIKNAYTGNSVTIAQSDGKAMGGNLPAVITLAANDSLLMVNTGKAWFSFFGK